MLRPRTRSFTAAAVTGLLIAGCSAGTDSEPAPGPDDGQQTAPEPEPDDEPDEVDEPDGSDGEPDDPFAVPDEIDEAYVEAVLNEILRQGSELTREVLSEEPDASAIFTEAQSQRLFELYDGDQDATRRSTLLDLVQSERARRDFLPLDELGPQRFEVEFVDRAEDGCVTAVGWVDLTEVVTDPFPRDEYAGVVLRRASEDDMPVNQTGWHLLDLRLLLSGGDPVPLEDIRGSDLGQILDVECEG